MRKAAAVAVAAAGVAVFVGAALAGPVDEAGAVDWFKPAAVDGGFPYVDLLKVPYDATPGRGDSIHATCAPGGAGVEIGVHPFDEQPRNLQVWDTSPPAPLLLDNVFEADWVEVYDFGWLAVLYSGDSRYDLVDPDTQRALCLGPEADPQPPVSSPTVPSVPTVESTVPVTDPPSVTVPVPDTTSPPRDTVVSGPAPSEPGVEVLTQRVERLPETGSSTAELVALGVALVLTGASIVARPGRKLTHGDES